MPKRPPTAHHNWQRQRILGIAGDLARQRGFASVRLADVATSADMKAPALYSYFRSRGELLAEVVRNTLETLQADITATDDPTASAAERLRIRCRRWSRHARESDAGEVLLLHRAIMESDHDPAIAAVIDEATEWTRSWFVQLLRTGRRRGEIRKGLDLETLADLINTCFFGIEVGAAHGLVRVQGDDLFEMFLEAILIHAAPRR
jgi:AcrR family transcriptional regulator